MSKLEECVRSIQLDGLLWGASKLVPVGYGIKKLQINCVVEDDKVGTDILEEEITKFEDYVSAECFWYEYYEEKKKSSQNCKEILYKENIQTHCTLAFLDYIYFSIGIVFFMLQ